MRGLLDADATRRVSRDDRSSGGPYPAEWMVEGKEEVLSNIGAIPVGGSPAELDAFVRAEVARWTSGAKTARITLD
jgi:hypothetical protein